MTRNVMQIEDEIRKLQDELRNTETRCLKKSDALSLEEKADAFDSLYDYALDMVKEAIKDQRIPKDARYYLFEHTMATLLGDEVWTVWNKYVT